MVAKMVGKTWFIVNKNENYQGLSGFRRHATFTIFKASEVKLWSSFIATDRSDSRLSGDFADFDENALIPSHTYPDIGFRGGKVRKMVRSEVPYFAQKHGHT